jgi:hypothetical protein
VCKVRVNKCGLSRESVVSIPWAEKKNVCVSKRTRNDPTFLELVTPLLYQTAHINDLPLSNAPRTPRLAELVPSLAYSSVRTAHISPSDDDPPLPQLDLPKPGHLHILIHQPRPCRFGTSFDSCANLLFNLDPPLLTFSYGRLPARAHGPGGTARSKLAGRKADESTPVERAGLP